MISGLCLLGGGGCSLLMRDDGQDLIQRRGVDFTEATRQGEATEFPADIAVPAVLIAAEMELERRGYTITRSDRTAERGLVIASGRTAAFAKKVRVESELSPTGTGVSVSAADRTIAAEILGAIANRLGLERVLVPVADANP
ncbi:MAG: hypothetical protein AAGI17_10900 [Planctomycetota bacterium]